MQNLNSMMINFHLKMIDDTKDLYSNVDDFI